MREYKTVGPNLKTYYYYTNAMADSKNAKGVIVIAPGIEGTGALYDDIGDYLESKGYALYTLDEWGYGKTGKVHKQIYKNWKRKDFHFTAYNVHALSVLAKRQHPDVPLYLIGNDFGAMLSLYLIREFPDVVDKVVTIGWGAPRAIDYWFYFTSLLRKIFLFDDAQSKAAHRGKNRLLGMRFERGEKYAWLSSDEDQVQKIRKAGFIDDAGTVGHYYHYFERKLRVPMLMRMKKTDKTTPLMFISGREDLTTDGGLSVKVLEKFYKLKGFTNVNSLVVDGRHELLFEKNRFENVDLILNWLSGESINITKEDNKNVEEAITEIRVVGQPEQGEVAESNLENTVVDVEVYEETTNYSFQEAEDELLIKTNKEHE